MFRCIYSFAFVRTLCSSFCYTVYLHFGFIMWINLAAVYFYSLKSDNFIKIGTIRVGLGVVLANCLRIFIELFLKKNRFWFYKFCKKNYIWSNKKYFYFKRRWFFNVNMLDWLGFERRMIVEFLTLYVSSTLNHWDIFA